MGCRPWGQEESETTEPLHFHFSLSCIGEGNGNPLQGSCLESPRDGGAWWAAVYGVAQSRTRLKWLSSSSSSNMMTRERVRMEPLSMWMASMSIYTWTEPPTGLYWTWRESKKTSDDLNHWDLGIITLTLGLPGDTVVKSLPASVGGIRDTGSIPGSGRFPEGGNGNPLQYSCLENSTDSGAWWAAIHGVHSWAHTHLNIAWASLLIHHPSHIWDTNVKYRETIPVKWKWLKESFLEEMI